MGQPDMPADEIEKGMAEACPLGRCALPEDVARVVAFLVSGDGGWVNGTCYALVRRLFLCIWIQLLTLPINIGQVITISGGSSQ